MKAKTVKTPLILSICIPNFNQSFAMDFALKYILEHRMDSIEGVEILISDNSSNDGSIDIISKYAALLHLEVYFQETNIGFLGQLLFLSKKAKGRYLLFLGAGDLIDASSLNSILQTLQKNNFAILTYDAIEPEFPTYPNLSKNAVIITSSLKDSHIPYFSPSISCNIFERKNFLEATKNIGELRDEWPHAQVALSFARSNLERGYSAQQILQVHPTDSGWSHTQFAYDVLIEYERIMRAFVSSISESVDLYNPNIGINANKVNRILALKLLGVSPKRNQFSDLTKLYAQRSLLFFKFIILCALPANFLKVLRNLHRKTKFFKIF